MVHFTPQVPDGGAAYVPGERGLGTVSGQVILLLRPAPGKASLFYCIGWLFVSRYHLSSYFYSDLIFTICFIFVITITLQKYAEFIIGIHSCY